MNRISSLFQDSNHSILSIYFCAGTPTLEGTVDVIQTLEQQGVDLIEIGIPFSDPMADGPVIQTASNQALRNGMSVRTLFEQLKEIRPSVRIPLVLMGYLNPIVQYGFEAFCQQCATCGIDGVIIPDLPFHEYQNLYKKIADAYDVKLIMLITPETSEERVRQIDAATDCFIYMVSAAATTGARNSFSPEQLHYFSTIKSLKLKNPCLIGFGISNPETYTAACTYSSGAIIGSSFVALLEQEKDPAIAITRLKQQIGYTATTSQTDQVQ